MTLNLSSWRRPLAGLALGLCLLPAWPAQGADDFLPPEQAFQLNLQPGGPTGLQLHAEVAPGYHLYRERLSLAALPAQAMPVAPELPAGQPEFDANFNKTMAVYRGTLELPLPVRLSAPLRLVIGHQGCADKGLCYPPVQTAWQVRPVAGGLQVTRLADDQPPSPPPPPPGAEGVAPPAPDFTSTAPAAPGQFGQALQSGSLWRVAGVFLLAGLLLSFTPCVLPMIPILSSIIVGQRGTVSRWRGFSLAAAYALGMALVYTAFGMVAGLLGEGLAGALQNAWVLGGFALLLVTLSLSMFGLYELQMPSGLQNRLSAWSGQLQGGQYAGVFLMGGLSALIVGPCVAAPLAGALVYISQTRDVLLGGVALFSLASGMSVPLLLVGLSAGTLLPRAGAWMERVKHLFGLMLLAVALWMVSPVLPAAALMLLISALLLAAAVYLGAFERLPEQAGLGRQAVKGLGLGVALFGALELAGVASGGRDALQPLRHIALVESAQAAGRMGAPGEPGLAFEPVRSLAELQARVQAARQPVMLDFYADWCVSCKELDALTFSDPAVRQALRGVQLLRMDVTETDAGQKALMKQFGLFGPPALLFFAPQGAELSEARVVGYQGPEAFLRTLQRVGAVPAAL